MNMYDDCWWSQVPGLSATNHITYERQLMSILLDNLPYTGYIISFLVEFIIDILVYNCICSISFWLGFLSMQYGLRVVLQATSQHRCPSIVHQNCKVRKVFLWKLVAAPHHAMDTSPWLQHPLAQPRQLSHWRSKNDAMRWLRVVCRAGDRPWCDVVEVWFITDHYWESFALLDHHEPSSILNQVLLTNWV